MRQRQVISVAPQPGLPVSGYEIHQGITQWLPANAQNTDLPYQALFEDASLGVTNATQSVWGSYLHGMFDNGPWRRVWINCLRKRRGLPALPTGISNYREQRDIILNELADLVVKHVDLTPLLNSLEPIS